MSRQLEATGSFLKKHTLLLCTLAALFTATVPFVRAFFHVEVSYNEGWNVYNAERVANHQLLYPVKYGWTTVNYPVLSFYLGAWLHRLTHDFLFTERVLSLLAVVAIGLVAACILRTWGASAQSSAVAGLFTFAVFCANADFYVGVDDPQLLANAVFLLGFLIYLRSRHSKAGLCLAALVFVAGGCIKQTPVDFVLAALIDLAFVSLPLTLWFASCLTLFAAAAVALNIHFGGPFFLAEILARRSWSFFHVLETLRDVFAVIPILFLFALYLAWQSRRDPRWRTLCILFAVSLAVGIYFSGAHGVSINGLFSPMIAMCLVLALACDARFVPHLRWLTAGRLALMPLALFVWLIIPLTLSGNINPIRSLHEVARSQARFRQDMALLTSRPGPVLCESLLECYSAGKPYLYDPFNATRFIHQGKLDDQVIVQQLQRHNFAFVQLNSLTTEGTAFPERFDPAIYQAIVANYTPVLVHPEARDPEERGLIYAPKLDIAPTEAPRP